MKDIPTTGLVFICVVVLLVSAILIKGIAYQDRFELIRNEAVKRGYAEWYSEKEGQQPNKWRWKESVE